MKEKVLLGLSGGVDSAIAAHKLLNMGYDVTGAFMRNWDAITNNDILGNPTLNNNQCPQEADYWDAVSVAKKLGIPLIRIDYVKEYWDDVFTHFLEEYKKGRTPNPDILCNSEIKFGPFLKYAMENGYDYISMGHYAKKVAKDGHFFVSKPFDKTKDQTYFLCALSEEQIEKCLWPMENITKTEAREIAAKLGLDEVSSKHGSTGVCFIGERNFREFLKNYFPAQPGDIVDIENGRVLGKHIGVLYYTIGQRRGLGIGGVKGEPDTAWFVAKKDVINNVLFVGRGAGDEHLNSDRCVLSHVNWIGERPTNALSAFAKFRYRQQDNPVKVSFDKGTIVLDYNPPVKAVTPGQWAAIYSADGRLLGGGVIEETYYKGKRRDI